MIESFTHLPIQARDLQTVLSIHCMIAVFNACGKISYVNEKFCEISGYSRQELLGQDYWNLNPSLQTGDLKSEILDEIRHHRFWKGELKNRRSNGSHYHMEATITSIYAESEVSDRYLAISTDITPRENAERSGQRLTANPRASDGAIPSGHPMGSSLDEINPIDKTFFDHAPDGILLTDLECNCLAGNTSLCRMLGYSPEELAGLHAADLLVDKNELGMRPALVGIQSKLPLLREWEFLRKDGSTFPAEAMATMMPNGNILGIVRDISMRRNREAMLHLREKALAEVSQGVLICDEHHNIIYANKSFTKITGYEESEILGMKCSILHGKDTDAAVVGKIYENLVSGMPFEGEILNYRKDGTPFWNDLSVVHFRSPNGGSHNSSVSTGM